MKLLDLIPLLALLPLALPVVAQSGQPESIQVRVGDLVFDTLVAGPEHGEPVILLHGFPQTAWSYRHQMTALAEAGYRAVAPNQRGYSPGARPGEVAEYAMPYLVGDVLGIAGALGIESFHLVGHDWGGAVAWVVAASAPERVKTLTALSTPHVSAFGRALADPNDDQGQRSSYFAVFSAPDAEERFLADDAAFLRGILSQMPAADVEHYVDALGTPEAIGGALNWYRASGLTTGAPPPASTGGAPPLAVSVPTVYVWGNQDIAFSRGAAEATAEFVTGPYRFEELDGVGHWLMERAGDRVTELLLEHVRTAGRH